jgi:hypothetical protein
LVDRARAATPADRPARFVLADVLDPASGLRPDGYDAVVALSSLHHLPTREALARFKGLLRPGGTLVVVGLYQSSGPTDLLWRCAGVVANVVVGLVRAGAGTGGKPDEVDMPVAAPTDSLPALRDVAQLSLPGFRLRRALFFRYLLRWDAPLDASGSTPPPSSPRRPG